MNGIHAKRIRDAKLRPVRPKPFQSMDPVARMLMHRKASKANPSSIRNPNVNNVDVAMTARIRGLAQHHQREVAMKYAIMNLSTAGDATISGCRAAN